MGMMECVTPPQNLVNKYVTDKAVFEYQHTLIDGDYAFFEWTAKAGDQKVCDSADGFVIKDGRIILQTIHYAVEKTE